MPRPIALTFGEPAGIGPDLTIALWRRRGALDLPPFYVIADREFLARRAKLTGAPITLGASEPNEAAAMPTRGRGEGEYSTHRREPPLQRRDCTFSALAP